MSADPSSQVGDTPKKAKRGRAPRVMDDSPWAWFSKAAHERALSAGQHLAGQVYIGLCICQSNAASHGKIEFFASIANVSRACGVPTRTVSKYIPMLEKCGLVRRISGRHGGENGAHCANRWMLFGVLAPGADALPHRVRKLKPAKSISGANKKEVQCLTGIEITSPSPAAPAGSVEPAGRSEETEIKNTW